MELIEKQTYNAHIRFIRKKLIDCKGLLTPKEINNLLYCLEFLAIHNNALEKEIMDSEYLNDELKSSIKETLHNLNFKIT